MSRYIAKVLVAPDLYIRLAGEGLSPSRYMQIWGFGEDGDGIYFIPYANGRRFDIEIGTEQLAISVSQELSRLYSDPRQVRWVLDVDQNGNIIAKETMLVPDQPLENQKGQRVLKKEIGRSFNISIKHGLTLSIWNPEALIKIQDVSSFLGEAISRFKDKRSRSNDDEKWNGLAVGLPYSVGPNPIGWIGVWYGSKTPVDLTIENILDSMIATFAASTSVVDLLAMLPEVQKKRDSPELQPVIDALVDEKDGLKALENFVATNINVG